MSVFPLQLAFYFYWIITFHKKMNLSVAQVIWYSIEILQLPAYKILLHFHSLLASEADNASNSIRYAMRSHLEMSNKTAAYFSNWQR